MDATNNPSPPRSKALEKNLSRKDHPASASGSDTGDFVNNALRIQQQPHIQGGTKSPPRVRLDNKNDSIDHESHSSATTSRQDEVRADDGGSPGYRRPITSSLDQRTSEAQLDFRLAVSDSRAVTQTGKVPQNTNSPSTFHTSRTPMSTRVDSTDSDIRDPYDTGWAWMIVLGTFIILFVSYSHHYVLASLLLDITEKLDITVTSMTVLLGVIHFLYALSTQVLVNLLMPFIPIRLLSTLSALIYAVSTLAIAFWPTFPVFCIISIVKYTVVGGVCIPSLNLIGLYFKQYRPFAIGLSLLGISAASMIVPPFARYLREEYGVWGVFFILAGWELNAVVAALLLRPIKGEQQNTPITACGTTGVKAEHHTSYHSKAGHNCSPQNLAATRAPTGQYTTVYPQTAVRASSRTVVLRSRPVLMTILLNDCQLLMRTIVRQPQRPPKSESRPEVTDNEEDKRLRQRLSRSLSSSDPDLRAESASPGTEPSLGYDSSTDSNGNVYNLPLAGRRSVSCTLLEVLGTDELQKLEKTLDVRKSELSDSGYWQWLSYSNLHKMAKRYLSWTWWSGAVVAPASCDQLDSVDSVLELSDGQGSHSVIDLTDAVTSDSDRQPRSHRRSSSDFEVIDRRDDFRLKKKVMFEDEDSEYFFDPVTLKKWASENNIDSEPRSEMTRTKRKPQMLEVLHVNEPKPRKGILRYRDTSSHLFTLQVPESPHTSLRDTRSDTLDTQTSGSKASKGTSYPGSSPSADIQVCTEPSGSAPGSRQTQAPHSAKDQAEEDTPTCHHGHDGASDFQLTSQIMQQEDIFSGRVSTDHTTDHALTTHAPSGVEAAGLWWGSSLSITSITSRTSQDSVPSPARPHWQVECMKALRAKLKPPLLKNYLAILIFVAYTLCYSGMFVEFFLPSFALTAASEDVEPFKAGLLVTMVGFSYTVTRLCYGYFIDLGMLRPSRMIATTAVLSAVLCSCAGHYTTFGLFVFFAFAFGSVGFAGSVLSAPLIVQILGVEDLGKMMSMCALVRAVLVAVQFPIQGQLYQATGTFQSIYYYSAVSYGLGCLLLLLEPVVRWAQDWQVARSGQRPYKQRMVKYIRPPHRTASPCQPSTSASLPNSDTTLA